MRAMTSLAILLIHASLYAGGPLIVAHRGASKDAPENTVPAFELAWKQGADAIEVDVRLTKDGHIVCIHDANTNEVAKTRLVVAQSTLAELRALDVGVHRGKIFEGTPIPTLSEVFSTIPNGKIIYVEIKCGPEIIPILIEEIKKSGTKKEKIVVICFNAKVLRELKTKAPQYKVSWLCSFKKAKMSGAMEPSLDTILKTLKFIQSDAISSNSAMPETFIDAIKKKGYEWHVWTVNDIEKATRLIAMGAESITTDVPGRMKKNLIENSSSDDRKKASPTLSEPLQ